MRAVLDTNILVRAVLSTGSPHRIYLAWLDERFELIISPALLAEMQRVLARRRIIRRIEWSSDRINAFFAGFDERALWVDPEKPIERITTDPDYNRLLEAAVDGGADYIVSGDRHLLDLKRHEDTEIVTPRHFLAILTAEAMNQ